MDSLSPFHSGAIRSMSQPFHVPVFLSVQIPLAALWPCMLDIACNDIRGFIVHNFTRPHIHRSDAATAFLPSIRLEPFLRGFVSHEDILTMGIL